MTQHIEKQRKYHEILITLRKITRAIDLHSKQLVQQYGLTGPQMLLLKTILSTKEKWVTSKQLSEALSLSQATISSIVDRLVKNGYVCREKSSTDRRNTLIKTTSKAASLIKEDITLLQDDFICQFDCLKDWEQTQMLATLQRIAEMMHAKSLDASPVLSNAEIE